MKRRGVTVLKQRHDWDCGVAALAMLLSHAYGDVAAFARDLIAADILDATKLRRRGLVIHELQILADGFGMPLLPVYRAKDYLIGRTGILGMLGGEMDPAGHWVVLKAGAVVDPDGGDVWSVEDYTTRHKCRPTTLLVERL